MSFNPRFTTRGEEYFLPPHSSYLWQNPHVMDEAYGEHIFTVLLEKRAGDAGNNHYYLSDKIAYDNEAIERLNEPLRSALKNKIAAVNAEVPGCFISFSEMDSAKHSSLRLLSMQWVMFYQEPYSQDEPALMVGRSRQGDFLELPATMISTMDDVYTLHHEYYLVGGRNSSLGGNSLTGLMVAHEDTQERVNMMADRAETMRQELGLVQIDDLHVTELLHIENKVIGIPANGVRVIDERSERNGKPAQYVFEAYCHDNGVILNMAMFGKIAPASQNLHLVFPDTRIRAIPIGKHTAVDDAQLSGMLTHILHTLRDEGTWPLRERPGSVREYLYHWSQRLFGFDRS